MVWGKVSVTHRHLDRLVSHQLRHSPNVDACHDQAARKSVPKAMPGEIIEACSLDGRLKPVARRARATEDKLGLAIPCVQFHKCVQRASVERQMPHGAVLTAPNRQLPALEIHLIPA